MGAGGRPEVDRDALPFLYVRRSRKRSLRRYGVQP